MQKSKILAFLLALVVSIVLWFYAVTVVNPDDTITISGISVQFEGTEALTSQGLMLTGGDSTKVSIKVSGRRSDLKELNNETVTAIADVTRIAASGSYQLSWSVVWPSTVATGDISETSRAPSRISVTVSDIKENPEVPIELEYTGEPKTGYMIDKSNLTLGTQSISVRGPAEEVNKIARAVVRVDVTDADALIDTDCPVVLLDKDGNELSLSQYVTSSADSVRVTIPILQYKDIKLNATLVSGGGATSEDAEVTIEPSTLRVTGNTAVLDAMADELTIRTIDLAQITGTETFEVTPELPSGVTSRADSQTSNISLAITTLIIGWGLVIAAVFQGAIWLQTRSLPASGWRLFNVIITLILGLMVIFGWPESTAWFVGTLIAVELIFSGWTLLLYAFSGNSARR